jgi:hypothetical protein
MIRLSLDCRPAVNVPVASSNYWGNDGFGFFFQRNWNA